MSDIQIQFERIKNLEDPEKINNFLISLSNTPDKHHLNYVHFFMENSDSKLLNDIKLNLIYEIGEIGKLERLEDKYINFLMDQFFKSDRWIRNEIISSLNKIMNKTSLPNSIFKIINFAITDEYIILQLNSLKLLLNFSNIPNDLYTSLLRGLNSSEQQIVDLIASILKKFIVGGSQLFKILDDIERYSLLNSTILRRLLMSFFSSVFDLKELDEFKTLISNSNWDSNHKEYILKEIETYLRILSKNL
ncbi:MAG: hypothetical protein ACFFAO_07165 [Candidatus Hermodarchaeota archaeon]